MEDGHVYISDLQEGGVHAVYLVAEARKLTTKAGSPYLALTLKDNSGSVAAKRWDATDEDTELCKQGSYIELRGEVQEYKNTPQIVLHKIRTAPDDLIDESAFIAWTPFDPEELYAEVVEMLEGLADEHLKSLAQTYLDDEAFMQRFKISPAAQRMHHPYRYGLLEHVHSVMKLGQSMAAHYEWVDASMVILGLFLHDSGKLVELTGEEAPGYSVEGELLGHITIGINMLDRKLQQLKRFPNSKAVLLKHIILSHHGLQEWGSPKPPMTAEAQLVHTVEMLDAKMNAFKREREEPAETEDATGGLRWSKLLKRKIVTWKQEPTE